MRFSSNGYYVERYVKCANCGVLVYGAGIVAERAGRRTQFCSDWCVSWFDFREADAPPPPPSVAERPAR